MEEDDVCELIRSVIMSEKGGVLLKNLNKDFIFLAGEPIPYEKLGYKSLEELLKTIPEVRSSVDRNGEIRYTSQGKNCEHLSNLISRQKSSGSAVSHPRHLVSHHRNAYSGIHQGKKTVSRNLALNADRSSKVRQNQKSFSEKKRIPKERDISATERKLGLEPGSGAKIDLPPLRRSRESLQRLPSDRILRESCRFNDCETEHDEIPPLVFSRRLSKSNERSMLQNLEKPPGMYQDTFQCPEGTKWKSGMDLRSVLSHNHSRDFLNGKMRSDNMKVNHYSHRASTRQLGRLSYNAHDLECRRRLGTPSSLCNNDNQSRWKDNDESRWDSEENSSYHTDRKCDIVSGMLRITIKNS